MATNTENKEEQRFALGKENLKLLLIGFLIIIAGFVLMIGGGSVDPNVFNKEIFSFDLTPFLKRLKTLLNYDREGERKDIFGGVSIQHIFFFFNVLDFN